MSTVAGNVNGRTPTPVGTAEGAAEALRTLNHLTLAAPSPGVPGWEDVGDIYRVLGELRALTDRLPQTFGQLAAGLQQLGDRADWHTDDGTNEHPDAVVADAIEGLHVAGCIADDIGRSIQRAHCSVAHLYQ